MLHRIAPRGGTAFELAAGESPTIIDPSAEQATDLPTVPSDDVGRHDFVPMPNSAATVRTNRIDAE